MTDHLEAARAAATDTYRRRKARRAAEELATVDPELWDEHTRNLVRKLGNYDPARPELSWVDLALDAAFGDTYDRAAQAEADERNARECQCSDYACICGRARAEADERNDTDIRYALADDLERMGLMPRPARPSTAALQATNDAARATLEALRVKQETGCPDCWQDHGRIHHESCRVALELRKRADPSWNSSRCARGHQHSTADNAYACDMLPGVPHECSPECEAHPAMRALHDNGDYRA